MSAQPPTSLESRISKPSSWADEVASPTSAAPPQISGAVTQDAKDETPQVDGAVDTNEGSNLEEAQYEVEVKLADLQADANSPLYSALTFKQLNLNENILMAISKMGFQKPSKIQSRALPLLLMDPPRNMIAQSQSGTGKTAAFVITILSRLDFSQPDSPQAVCLAPSRELARQIEGVFRSMGEFIPGLTIQAAVPGAVERNAKVKAMVIVGTPGTVLDLIKRRQLNSASLRIFCLDEADNMLDQQGLGDQCMQVRRVLPNLNQVLLFSATFPDEVNNYAAQFAPGANEIRLARNDLTVSSIHQMYIDCSQDNDHKYKILVMLYDLMQIGSSIIFVKTRETADRIAAALQAEGHKVVAVHGAFDGADRDAILADFRNGKSKVLITTNVLARGIDVQSVSMVINYDIPTKGRSDEPDAETYLHRIGRTGRFGRVGVSISFIFDRKSHQALSAIATQYGIDLKQLDPDNKEEMESLIKETLKSSRAQAGFTTAT